MNAPRIILDSLPCLCQKSSHLVEVWHNYNKNNFACFFETRCSVLTLGGKLVHLFVICLPKIVIVDGNLTQY